MLIESDGIIVSFSEENLRFSARLVFKNDKFIDSTTAVHVQSC